MSIAPVHRYGDSALNRWLDRRPRVDAAVVASVEETVADVDSRGAAAVLDSARRYDAPGLDTLFVSEDELAQASVSVEDLEAIRHAIQRVTDFHQIQLDVITVDWEALDFGWGWRTDATAHDGTGFEGQRLLPLGRVGVYVPGGRACYPSSVIMNAVPARVAGVKDIVIATPAAPDGRVPAAVLVAARELGVTTILKAGGAAAVAAMAFGIDGLPRVDKILGPGNSYVNEAKRQLWGAVGLDAYAGPSEVCVVVDDQSDPTLAAADLLTQVEHAPDNVGVAVSWSSAALSALAEAAEAQLAGAEREATMREALLNEGAFVLVPGRQEALEVVNRFAPEHVSVHCVESGQFAAGIVNSGCVLLGADTPQSAGDFAAGPSHTLPTSGGARFASPVNVQEFLKFQSVSSLELVDVRELAKTISAFGRMEGFPAHAAGAFLRLE